MPTIRQIAHQVRLGVVWVTVLALAASTSTAQAQRPVGQSTQNPKDDPQVIRIRTELLQLDAVVRDRDGAAVTDLTGEDFEITTADGKHAVEFCTYIRSVSDKPISRGEFADGRPARDEPGRRIAIIVALPLIDVGISVSSRANVYSGSMANTRSVNQDTSNIVRALHQFVDDGLRPEDVVAIHSTDVNLGLLSLFSNDRSVLHASIEGLRKGTTQAKSTHIMVANDGIQGDLIGQSLSVLQTLDNAMQQVGRMPGRKVVVLVSRGLASSDALTGSERVRERMRGLINEANRSGISIYTIDPRSLGVRSGGGLQDSDSLFALSNETGGKVLHNTNDMAAGLSEIMKENEGYYLLGYHLRGSDDSPEMARISREVKLRVKRPGLTVQTRRVGYSQATSGEGQGGENSLRQALSDTFALRQIGIGLTPMFHSPDSRSARITSFVDVDPSGLSFTEERDGRRSTSLELAWRVTGPDGRTVKSEARAVQFAVSAPDLEKSRTSGLPFAFGADVLQPGYFLVDVALRDVASGRVGNARRAVQVPDLTKSDLAASTLILSRVLSTGATGTSADLVRSSVFAPLDSLEYQTVVYHAKLRDSSVRLKVRARIMRGDETLVASEGVIESRDVEKGARITGRLQLPGLVPGVYGLEVFVNDLNGKSQCTLESKLEVHE